MRLSRARKKALLTTLAPGTPVTKAPNQHNPPNPVFATHEHHATKCHLPTGPVPAPEPVTPCPHCADKDKHIMQLRNEIAQLRAHALMHTQDKAQAHTPTQAQGSAQLKGDDARALFNRVVAEKQARISTMATAHTIGTVRQ